MEGIRGDRVKKREEREGVRDSRGKEGVGKKLGIGRREGEVERKGFEGKNRGG